MAKAATKAKTKAAEPKTFDDLRRYTLELAQQEGQYLDLVVEMLLGWSTTAGDAEVMTWLGYLPPAHATNAAGLLAVQRDRAGKAASAKKFLAQAEKSFDPDDRAFAMMGLVAAKWRLGKTREAEAAFRARIVEVVADRRETNIASLIAMAALGKRAAEIPKLLAEPAWADDLWSEFQSELLPVAVVGLISDGDMKAARALLAAWTKLTPDRSSSKLGDALADHFAANPAGYFQLLLEYPTIIGLEHADRMLAALERTSPEDAVRVATAIVANDELPAQLDALAVLAAHAPDRLGARADTNEPDERAALGKRVNLARVTSERVAYDIARVTADRALAIAALKRAVEKTSDPECRHYVPLAKLGEHEWIKKQLDVQVAAIHKLAPGRRDLPCRAVARVAAAIGLSELAFAVAKLPSPAAREYSARAMADSFARAGDFTNALAALDLIPKAWSRVEAAVQGTLSKAHVGLREWDVRVATSD